MATYQTTNRNIDTICIMGNDTNWNEIDVHSVPKGITAMSKLLNYASNGRDFNLDNIKKDHVPLMKHPESFRKTLVQIANDYYEALVLAHTNMEKIQLQMAQVPDYVKECVELLQFNNKTAIKILLPRNLKRIEEAAADGLKHSEQVRDAFDRLNQLIRQVILAITASHGAREREIEEADRKRFEIHVKMMEEIDCRLRASDRKRCLIQQQMEDARRKVRFRQQELEEARRFGVGDVFGLFIFSIPLTVRIGNARTALNVAEERLQEIQQEAKRAEEERTKIYEEYITKRFHKILIDVEKGIRQDEMIELLKEGMSQLSILNSNWSSFTQNFNSIHNYIQKVTKGKLTDFVEYAQFAQEDTSMIDFMTDSINKSLECSIKTHQTAKMYVEFSNENIMQSLNDMQRYKNALPSC